MLTVLVALLAAQTGSPPAQAKFPTPSQDAPKSEYINWSGFGFLPAGDRVVPTTFPVAGDWSGVEAKAAEPATKNAKIWRLKLFILRRIDEVEKLPDGTLWEEKCVLEQPDIERIRRSALLLKEIVHAETDGALELQPSVEVADEEVVPDGRDLGGIVNDYVYPRVNGGLYDADDHVYRGPFESVICVHPLAGDRTGALIVNDTPVNYLSGYSSANYSADGLFAVELANVWLDQVRERANDSGIRGALTGVQSLRPMTGLPNPLQYVPNGDWSNVLGGADQTAAAINDHLKLDVVQPDSTAQRYGKLSTESFEGAGSSVSIVTDPQHGSVLDYKEVGSGRTGGLNFPVPTKGGAILTVSKTPTLAFSVKTSSLDALALRFSDDSGHTAEICLGRDRPGDVAIPQNPLERDGLWHDLKLDLKATGLENIVAISLAPTENGLNHTKATFGPVEYAFAGFQATSDAPDQKLGPIAPSADSIDAFARAEFAHTAQPGAQLLALLKDPEWFVRLNAIQQYQAAPPAEAEPSLTENATLSIDGPVTAAALDALWKLQTDSAKRLIQRVIASGVTEQGRAEAANLDTQSKDPGVALDLEVLTQSRSLRTRMLAAEYLGRLPGSAAAILRMTLLQQADPELKLAVTRTVDPNDPYQVKKLLWSAVNEPSDAVRVESDEKLIQSSDASARTEGYKGVKDDSVGVRLLLLKYLADHPNEAHRNALEIAVTDRSPRVVAAAITAFATLDKGATSDELGAVVQDRHPAIQLALLNLSAKRGLKLSDAVVSQMKNSPDLRVQEAAKKSFP